ncbi:hypothetical protein NXH67_05575 [Butyrivibrio sp. DSM 10294]|uniref:hypothetical protein n=1 Tax=Butyrivibrio sp. DSM 10294 TaxID=2972457 RepID=UPI00234EE2A9|nr:hypothetical protein [Butyrivibrio sp. DSM 10294]MDC7292983.1 hypothetical protein [Butyrivibrio sp. DSM 10294]
MIELLDEDKLELNTRSSKGNQLKFRREDKWYKADYAGYEGLAEYVVSHLLAKSSLASEEFVIYRPEKIKYKHQLYNGAVSDDFLSEGWQLITLERLFKTNYGQSLNSLIYRTEGIINRLGLLVSQVERLTGLTDFGFYMQKNFAVDALFLNEDRHTHNIAVLANGKGEYRKCPIFDNGACLLSDTTQDYPLGIDVYELMNTVKSKTICDSFDEQLEAAERLYGNNLKFNFTHKDVDEILSGADSYDNAIIERVRDIIYAQMRKYKYLFK